MYLAAWAAGLQIYENLLVNIENPESQSPQLSFLLRNYPNPFSRSTIIRYYLPGDGKFILTIYDYLGRLIKSLARGEKKVGVYELLWNGRDEDGNPIPGGIYFLRLETADHVEIRKIIKLP
ncbi:hypothetical protein DRN74_05325 [Candidatus Micrarchaeota archaeon]|nr:MAG: hypothetical protein DRN74_05325 [Candidatus Micrarchaeota archaeon]